ncbi:MAG TPA: MucR family transcriptional regulator [Rhizomicrobium sp.]|nr:MucR family transcriptional regulator [Rhizomicrobium sp.]
MGTDATAKGKGTGEDEILKLVTEIVAAYVSKNPVPASELPTIIRDVHATLGGFAGAAQPAPGKGSLPRAPAVPIRKSVQPDHIVCLEDGKKLKMLKRYLRARYKMSPEEYRARWNLPPDYPMVAPGYAARRSEFAKKIGLGKGETRKPRRKA